MCVQFSYFEPEYISIFKPMYKFFFMSREMLDILLKEEKKQIELKPGSVSNTKIWACNSCTLFQSIKT